MKKVRPTKVLVIAKEYPNFYMKEMYVLWETKYDRGTWYHLSEKPNDIISKLYLGEKQFKHL